MPTLATDLDAYRREGEAFMSALDAAYYRHFAGHVAELPVAALYERHAHLFTAEVAAQLRAAAAEATGDEARALRALAEFAVDGCLGQATKRQEEALALREAEAEVRVDGERMSFRQAAARMANEPDRHRRAALEAERLRVVDAELNPLHRESWSTQHALARELGADSYRDLYEGLKGVDLDALHGRMRWLQSETDELYERAMDRALRRSAGVGLADAARSDIPRVLRGVDFDPHFPSDRLVPALERTLEGLGIDLRRQANIVLDTERRPHKSPRAFCAPVRVPDEIYLVVAPIGGVDDYRALFHEAGHTEHFANAARGLPFEFRYLGDNAVTEGYAFLLEGLTHDPAWLTHVLGYRDHGDYLRHTATARLYYHRRYAAKLAYELELHGGAGIEGMEGRYAELLTEALRVPWPEQTYLSDVDPGFYAVNYIRAWSLEVLLRTLLRERYGTRWFTQRAAGDFLRELWHEGQRLPADELARELGLPAIDPALLADEAYALLG